MSARSTAGVGVESPCAWLMTVAAAGYRAGVMATAVQVAREAGRIDLRSAAGVAELARRSRQKRDDVGRHLAALVADGFLDAGARGRGWGVRTSYSLALPSLYRRSEVPEMAPDSGRCLGEMAPDSGRSFSPSPLLGVLKTYVRGEASTEIDADLLTAVLDRLPEELRPRTAEQLAETTHDVAGWIARGWTPEAIGRRAREGLKPGPVSWPPKMLRLLVPTRPPAHLRETPTPDRFVGRRIELQPEVAAAGAAAARAQLRGGAS